MRFIALVEEVKKDRKENGGEFEKKFMEVMTERSEGLGMRGKKRAYNEEDDELLKLMHYGVESV